MYTKRLVKAVTSRQVLIGIKKKLDDNFGEFFQKMNVKYCISNMWKMEREWSYTVWRDDKDTEPLKPCKK